MPGSDKRDRSGSIAVIGAVAAALIATIGAVGGPLWLQNRDNHRQDHREAVQAKGAARILFEELLASAEAMQVLNSDRILRPFDPSYRVSIPPEDLRLVASTLKGEQWGAVQTSLTNISGLNTYVRTLIERGRKRLTSGEACLVRYDLRSVVFASDALARLAGAPGHRPALPAIDCIPKPGPLRGAR